MKERGKELNVEEIIWLPQIHILAQCGSTDNEICWWMLVKYWIINETLSTSPGIAYTDELLYYHEDLPANPRWKGLRVCVFARVSCVNKHPGHPEWVETRNLTWKNLIQALKLKLWHFKIFPCVCKGKQCICNAHALREGHGHAHTETWWPLPDLLWPYYSVNCQLSTYTNYWKCTYQLGS